MKVLLFIKNLGKNPARKSVLCSEGLRSPHKAQRGPVPSLPCCTSPSPPEVGLSPHLGLDRLQLACSGTSRSDLGYLQILLVGGEEKGKVLLEVGNESSPRSSEQLLGHLITLS